MELRYQNITDQSVEFSKKKSESKIKKSYIVGYSIFDIHWNSWSSISFNPKKPDACCGQ